jgi:hypothetical protein
MVTVARRCERANKLSGYTNGKEFNDQMNSHQLLWMDSAQLT